MECTVLVGVVKSRQQLEVNIAHKFYHIPAGNVTDDKFPIKYVALYLSENTFGAQGGGVCYIGEVADAVKCPRREITELPSKTPDTVYMRFNVKKWMMFPAPVKIHRKINICAYMDLSEIVSV